MIKAIFIIITLAIAVLLIYAATLPDTFHVARSMKMRASPERIFSNINNFHKWEAWTPYNRDPHMKTNYSGPDAGVGANYAWKGDSKVGEGSVTITESDPSNKIVISLDMIKPFRATNKVTFTLLPIGPETQVTWALEGKSPYFAKVIGLIFDCEKMTTDDFELGLSSLKNVVEKS